MARVRAVLVEQFGQPPRVAEVDEPVCPADGVVVEVGATGLCRSDWHAWAGHDDGVRLPHVLGHELAGTVVEVGPGVTSWVVGDRVTTPFVLACGACETCRAGDGQVCERQEQPGFTMWGSWAERVSLPRAEVNLVRVPDGVSDEVACSLGCRFATAYRAVVQVAEVTVGETVVVHGCGGVGLSAVMVAVALGARVVAVDVAEESLAMAERLGARPVHGREVGSLAATAEVSLDCLGARETLAASIACLRPRGRHVQVGLLGGDDAMPPVDLGRVVAQELRVLGSHGLAAASYPDLLALVASGRVDPGLLVRDVIDLDAACGRLVALDRPGGGAGGVTVIRPTPESS